jgi:hypothetical protein
LYSDDDLNAAVAAGALSADAAASFRNFVAAKRAQPDEEQFRLLTGFNDIFVGIAVIVFLIAVAWLAGRIADWFAGAAVAAISWGLAEYFTRIRRMALPSIILSLGFYLGALAVIIIALGAVMQAPDGAVHSFYGRKTPITLALAGMLLAGAIYLHWRRFHVPITVAICALNAISAILCFMEAVFPSLQHVFQPLLLLGGLALFAAAMSWDISDPGRTTRRTDIAFWLHLAAAPLIVHGVFACFGILTPGAAQPGRAALVITVYLLMTAIALVIDRRALLTAALAYVLYAMSSIIHNSESPSTGFALSGFIIGAGLLTLSAFWTPARRALLGLLPPRLRTALPAAGA